MTDLKKDTSTRFVLVDADIRGNIVRLQDSYSAMTGLHEYPDEIQSLLGQFATAALLLSDTIKFEGRLTLQANGQGSIRLLMAEVTHEGDVRGIARLDEDAPAFEFAGKDLGQLLSGGTLSVTIEARGRERYQSIVPLAGKSLAECLEHYFQQSEQLNTFIRLATSSAQAAGILIQQLPVQLEQDFAQRIDRWETVKMLASTVTGAELMQDATSVLLRHLFADEDIQVYSDSPVRFQCSCSEERMASALISLGEDDLASLFDEQASLDINCEFCGALYNIDIPKLTALVTSGVKPH